ncbi:SusC/RagA family TonB-linked outer membrane protein [Phocaeicola massiliensis]|uniref:SusC/RagA family TonB-linked outer membrane protein n=1 Tax=Phocaeicola massiliensis B84634 = Timone 84634 = DSM 17679 = JCM 13223 TaxID=1121098 RepID=U6R847_9BACT|nr:TonB-dependent receptor [Phocaeicola massiliensis]EOA52455.1 SusC/RagA family TonB-linked outer membrane protein [Phocaeicola massiliensis B84634 = Timone 84634 = DSM 17679 = JCM 13223]MDQ7674388.1 putative outer membrane protein [Phocaeicola massiliensis]
MLKDMKTVGVLLLLSAISAGTAYAVPKWGTAGVKEIQQNGVCNGVVTDTTGETVIGASVVVKGTTNGTITGLDGDFSLSGVTKGSILVVSFVGYQNTEVKWNGQPLTIVLKEDTKVLDEVVVVGYGTQKKANLSGAVAAVDGKVLQDRPITNIGQGLQGVVPNLNITMNNGGAPGATSSFNIRGNTSLNGGSPLVLVDNVQMDTNLVNPDDIESISVLKDAASASIYGARAAYGVILITTKKGKKSDKPTVSLSATGYWQSPALTFHNVNSMQYLTMMDEAYQNDGGSGHYFKSQVYQYAEDYFNGKYDSPVFFDTAYDTYKYGYCGNTDWWDELYKTSFSQIYTANISGGNDRTTYYASVSMNEQGGILKAGDDKYNKYNANVNISSNITKWLNVSAKIAHTYTDELHPTGGTTAMNSTAYSGLSSYSGMMKGDLSPLMPVKHPDGHYAGQGSYTNPVAIMEQGGNAQYKQNDLWMTGAVKITPIKGLVINADYTWNFYGKSSNQHVQNFYDYTAVPGTENYYPWTNPSSVTVTNNDDYYNAFNAFAEYTFSLKEKHNFKVMVGYNQENKHKKYHYAGRKNLIDSSNPSLNLAYGDMAMNGSETHWSVNGFFARINYDYKGKYLLELNGRYDGSSKFPHGDRYAFFPSASVAWRVSEEKFWEPIRGWFDNFKLRASYGSLGNQALDESRYGNFPYLATYGINTKYGALLNGTRPVAVSVPGLVSASFTWETVNQIDFGFDASFFGGRLNTSFDWYRRNTKDMLTAGQALPAVLGTSVPQENAADMKTVGWEVSLEWNDRLSNGFGYHIKGVLSDYQASITKFSNPTKLLGTHYVGEKLNEIWGYVSNGLFQSDEDAKAADQSYLSGGSWGAGDVKYEDLNNDGKIDIGKNTLDDSGDRKIIGNSTPRYSYGITAGFDYKGFDFEMFWQGIGKRDYWLGGSQFWGFTDEWCTPLTSSLDYWTEDNRDAYFPRLHHYGVNGGNHQVSTRYLQNAAYLRLKNVVLGYTIPRSITEKVKISRLRVFVQGENLLTFTPLIDSYDPETLNNMTYPINKKISVGLNLTF